MTSQKKKEKKNNFLGVAYLDIFTKLDQFVPIMVDNLLYKCLYMTC